MPSYTKSQKKQIEAIEKKALIALEELMKADSQFVAKEAFKRIAKVQAQSSISNEEAIRKATAELLSEQIPLTAALYVRSPKETLQRFINTRVITFLGKKLRGGDAKTSAHGSHEDDDDDDDFED